MYVYIYILLNVLIISLDNPKAIIQSNFKCMFIFIIILLVVNMVMMHQIRITLHITS